MSARPARCVSHGVPLDPVQVTISDLERCLMMGCEIETFLTALDPRQLPAGAELDAMIAEARVRCAPLLARRGRR
jgi:hypothetical protein